jgi:hypothetical protein
MPGPKVRSGRSTEDRRISGRPAAASVRVTRAATLQRTRRRLWRMAPSGITWRGMVSRSAISAEAWTGPAPVLSAICRCPNCCSATPRVLIPAVFITEDDAQGGRDHVDAHRTVLLAAGPYAKRNYVSHTNSSFPGLLKTIFRILGVPPLNLFDAAASDLADCFTKEPDFTAYQVLPVDERLFIPEKARGPQDPQPGTHMDAPSFLREQHRR